MNLAHHPELLDRIAAFYALGALRGRARRRFETMARQSATVRASALLWQERLSALTELQPAEAPDPNVWKRIENMIAAERPKAAAVADKKQGGRLGWWRGAAFAGGLATLAAVTVSLNLNSQKEELSARLAAQPEVQYVAMLTGERADQSMLVTFDPKHNTLKLKRVGGYQEGPDKSLQLWALPATGGPKSLGVLPGGAVVRLAAHEQQVRQAPALAISLEQRGGVPAGQGPAGPVLWKGALIQTP